MLEFAAFMACGFVIGMLLGFIVGIVAAATVKKKLDGAEP